MFGAISFRNPVCDHDFHLPLALSASGAPLPLRRLSARAGLYVHHGDGAGQYVLQSANRIPGGLSFIAVGAGVYFWSIGRRRGRQGVGEG